MSQDQLRRAAKEDFCHVNNCALFLMKKGFPFISILGEHRSRPTPPHPHKLHPGPLPDAPLPTADGGFVAAHSFLLHRKSTATLGSLVDHVPNNCRMCKHEALVRFHRERALADAYGTGGPRIVGG
jgi:hypothetical protein